MIDLIHPTWFCYIWGIRSAIIHQCNTRIYDEDVGLKKSENLNKSNMSHLCLSFLLPRNLFEPLPILSRLILAMLYRQKFSTGKTTHNCGWTVILYEEESNPQMYIEDLSLLSLNMTYRRKISMLFAFSQNPLHSSENKILLILEIFLVWSSTCTML